MIQGNVQMRLEWTPRLQNREDALTNGDFRGFDPERRVRFCPDN